MTHSHADDFVHIFTPGRVCLFGELKLKILVYDAVWRSLIFLFIENFAQLVLVHLVTFLRTSFLKFRGLRHFEKLFTGVDHVYSMFASRQNKAHIIQLVNPLAHCAFHITTGFFFSLAFFFSFSFCRTGEHSDWAGGFRRFNSEIDMGHTLVVGTNQGSCTFHNISHHGML
jgi:hypothetical protein